MAKKRNTPNKTGNTITIKDLARETGVSQATVGRVLGGYGRTSASTKELVMAAAREMNYQPNSFAQGLKGKSTRTLGLMIANVVNPFFSIIVRAVEDACINNDYSLMVCNIDEDQEKERRYLRLLRSKRVDGLLTCSAYSDKKQMKKEVARLYEEEIPTVFVDRRVEGLSCPSIQTDSYTGSMMAVNHLIKLGHKRIGVVSHAPNVDTIQKRILGYKQALVDNGIKFDPELIVSNNAKSASDGFESTITLLHMRNRPTAILTTNSLVTYGALQAIKRNGARIPDDIAFIGWDDFELATAMTPEITVVTQPIYSLGNMAANKLFDMLKGGSNRKSVILSPQLLVRESCGATKFAATNQD
ncbi:MAG: LacI family transcriptional regulator [Planctomycetaceae bacterium]|nr:LacI family transcriptional regulator [Planctomycetaceae bacterium]